MIKEYGTKIDITAIARDYVNTSFYDNLNYFIEFVTDEISDLIKIYPELEDDILDEAMRLITIDYCKKKVEEKESKPNEIKVYAIEYLHEEPIKLFLNKEKAELYCNECNKGHTFPPYFIEEYFVEV